MLRSFRKALLGLGIAATAAFGAGTATDLALQAKAGHEVRMYTRYSIFDNIGVRVVNGNVELVGQVTEPYKKKDLGNIMQHIAGVASVTNDLEVLPLSPMDNQIRIQAAQAIYRDPVLARYSLQAIGPIHIIVNNGHITLEGVVSNEMERNVAAIRASGAGLSFGPVNNHLMVERPSRRS